MELHAASGGGAFVETHEGDRSLWVGPDEVALVELIDGKRSLTELSECGLTLSPPLMPERTAALIHGLELAGLLVESGAGDSAAAEKGRLLRRGLRRDWVLPAAHLLSEPGRFLPVRSLRPLASTALLAASLMVAWAASQGVLVRILSPLPAGQPVAQSLLAMLSGACVALTFRALVGAWTLRALGHPAPALAFSFRWALPQLHLMDRARRRLSQDDRLTLALAGLGAVALFAVATGALSLGGMAWAQPLSAAAWLILSVQLAPHWRTDMRNALGAATRLPGLATRATQFSRQARQASPAVVVDPARRVVALTATLLVLHSLGLLYALILIVVPDILHRAVASLLVRPGAVVPWGEQSLALAVAAITIIALVILWGTLLLNASRSVLALLAPAPRRTITQASDAADSAEQLQQSTVMRALLGLHDQPWPDAWSSAARQLSYAAHGVVSAGGKAAPGPGVVVEGELVVMEQDIAGVPFESGHLRPGDVVGLEHLSPSLPAPWLLRAATPTRLALLPPEVLTGHRSDASALAVLAILIRHTSLAATPVGRLPELLSVANRESLPADGTLHQAAHDALCVVVAGSLVLPGNESEPQRLIPAPGAVGCFARQTMTVEQMSRLRAGQQGAEVVVIPAVAIRQLLQAAFQSGARPIRRTRHTLAAIRLQTGTYESAQGEHP